MYWLPYTCGAVGLSVCSLWLLRHSSLMGSPDIDNWVRDAKESVAGFWDEHVEKPVRYFVNSTSIIYYLFFSMVA